jgi:DNA-binding IclR family transcriptional regulator
MARPSPQTDRVIALVELLAAHPGQALTLAELTRRLEVNKSTCHSMLASLTRAGWLFRDPYRKTYRLGPALVGIGGAASTGFPALEVAHSAMVELSLELAANCAALGVAGDQVTVLDQVRDLRAAGPGLRVGSVIPLRPPFGTAAVAWADTAAVDRWLSFLPEDAARQRHRAVLDATRSRGFAVEMSTTPEASLRDALARIDGDRVEELPELLAHLAEELAERVDFLAPELDPGRNYIVSMINAPVLDAAGHVVLVLSLNGFASRMTGSDIDKVGHRLAAVTAEVSAAV